MSSVLGGDRGSIAVWSMGLHVSGASLICSRLELDVHWRRRLVPRWSMLVYSAFDTRRSLRWNPPDLRPSEGECVRGTVHSNVLTSISWACRSDTINGRTNIMHEAVVATMRNGSRSTLLDLSGSLLPLPLSLFLEDEVNWMLHAVMIALMDRRVCTCVAYPSICMNRKRSRSTIDLKGESEWVCVRAYRRERGVAEQEQVRDVVRCHIEVQQRLEPACSFAVVRAVHISLIE